VVRVQVRDFEVDDGTRNEGSGSGLDTIVKEGSGILQAADRIALEDLVGDDQVGRADDLLVVARDPRGGGSQAQGQRDICVEAVVEGQFRHHIAWGVGARCRLGLSREHGTRAGAGSKNGGTLHGEGDVARVALTEELLDAAQTAAARGVLAVAATVGALVVHSVLYKMIEPVNRRKQSGD
jgi:hypothetical protein